MRYEDKRTSLIASTWIQLWASKIMCHTGSKKKKVWKQNIFYIYSEKKVPEQLH